MKVPLESLEDAKFSMTPMVDMVFLLLVFFMCASHLSSKKNKRLEIPTASKAVVPKDRVDRWVVNVDTNGQLWSGEKAITLETLKDEVALRVNEDPEIKVYLRGDAKAHHGEIKAVMRAMAETGIDEFIFGAYKPSDPGNP